MDRSAKPDEPSAGARTGVGRARRSLVAQLTRWQAATTFALGVVALSLLALFVAHWQLYGPRTRDLVQAISAAKSAHQAMLDQQGALRAFVVTGNEAFLEAYESGRTVLPAHNRTIDELAGDDLPRLVLEVRLRQAAWVDRWVGPALEAGRSQGGGAAPDDELLVEGKALFDEYREAEAALEARLLRDRNGALDAQERAISRTALLALTITGAAAAISLDRGRALRRRLDAAVADVDHRLERMGAGELAPRPPGQDPGPAELERIHDGLDAATTELATSRRSLQDQAVRAEAHNRQLGQVLRFAREVAGSLNLRYVLRGLCAAVLEITEADQVVVWLRNEDGERLEAVADSAGPSLTPVGLDPIELGHGVVGRTARFGRVHGSGPGMDGFDAEAPRAPGDVVAIPMVVGAEVTGVLEVRVGDPERLVGSTVPVLEALAVQAGTAVSAARLHEHTTVMAMTDALTRLPNRRRMEADLAKEVGISQRYQRPMAFAMLDVDHFKAYNDEFGHQAGDAALQSLSLLLAGSVRAGDTVYRYGGEELAVVMRETDAEGARLVADRLRAIVEHHFAAPGQRRAVTVSVGVAGMPAHATNADALVAAADSALYAAKREGRNRVCLIGDGGAT